MGNCKYRPEIDGLRGLAVLAVLLFHLDLGLTGGYVGVDVFFVISGFLITRIILDAQRRNQFRLKEFWIRRIRRLAPALCVLQVAVLAVGLWMLLPRELKDLADSSLAQVFLVSNFYFADHLNYFAGPAEFKPLLHTWSLAVEEQFYLLLPLLLVACRRTERRRLVMLLSGIALASFALSTWGLREYPTETFFLLPTRAWELLLGSLLVFLPHRRKLKAWLNNMLGFAGIVGIAFGAVCFDGVTPFPGPAALLPCLSTVLIIFTTTGHRTFVGRTLSWRPLVGIGLISYSLYLWHWPVIVFMKFQFGLQLAFHLKMVAIGLSLALGYFSWKYVETPFRRQQLLPAPKRMVRAMAACSLAIALVGLGLVVTKGLPGRWDPQVGTIFDHTVNYRFRTIMPAEIASDQLPMLGSTTDSARKPSVLIWADSHGFAVSLLCDGLAREFGVSGFAACRGATVPLLDVWRRGLGRRRGATGDAVRWNREVLDFIRRNEDIRHVILLARWARYIEDLPDGHTHDALLKDAESTEHSPQDARDVFARSLRRTITELKKHDIQIWIMKQIPLQNRDPIRALVAAALREETSPPPGVPFENHTHRQQNVNRILDSLPAGLATVLDPAPHCFDESGNSRIGTLQESYYHDYNHLSPIGAEQLLRPLFSPVFQQIAQQQRMVELQGRTETITK